ncbi:MAG: hypothetical protein IKE74_04700 [Mogibacterium sp.]|nr:hypothetical protein [Mogibacterium sp.]
MDTKQDKEGSGQEHGGKLSFDEFALLFNKLSDNLITGMLEDAELLTPEEAKASMSDEPRKRARARRSGRLLAVVIVLEILLLVTAVVKIYMSASINGNDPIRYSRSVDDVFCDEGHLVVNDVDVAVPVNGGESYSISYSWAKEDKDYPSVPYAANVLYTDDDEKPKYEMSLYRVETIPRKKIPRGKTADNWFDSWKAADSDGVSQKPMKSGDINGFYITPGKTEGGYPDTSYENYSYYFATQDKKGIHVYVLEGICHNDEYAEELSGIMDNSIKNISAGGKRNA